VRWRSYLVLLILLHSNLRFRNQRTKRSCHDFHVIERFYLTSAMHFCLFLVNFCYHHFSHAMLAFALYPCSHHALSLIWNRRHSYIMIHITTFFLSRLWYVYVFLAKWSSNKGCTYAITTNVWISHEWASMPKARQYYLLFIFWCYFYGWRPWLYHLFKHKGFGCECELYSYIVLLSFLIDDRIWWCDLCCSIFWFFWYGSKLMNAVPLEEYEETHGEAVRQFKREKQFWKCISFFFIYFLGVYICCQRSGASCT